VKVSFAPTATPQFTFVPESVTMKFAGKVILLKSPENASWKFQGATVKDDTLNEFRPSVQSPGNALHIFDELRDPETKTYSYNVTVALDGVSFTSPDPVIVNDPQ